jgi:D-apionolactonase
MTNSSPKHDALHGSNEIERLVFAFGSVEPPAQSRAVTAGPIVASIDGGALRKICFGTVELVRQIDFPIRDQDWVTLPPRVTLEKLETRDGGFRFERRFEVADGAVECCVVYEGSSEGVVTAVGEATARHDFVTNRTGFTLLHPLIGVTGRPVDVTAPSGAVHRSTMPDLIAPAQPIRDIAKLAFDIEGVKVDIAFLGEVFEMEDQRNWSDASFKTYCRPLVEPFAYTIPTGSTVRQEIRIKADGRATAAKAPSEAPVRLGAEFAELAPEILLAAEGGWLPDRNEVRLLARSGLKTLLLRVTPYNAARLIAEAELWLDAGGSIDLEIVLDDNAPAAPQLQRVARVCAEHSATPKHVVALPAAYLLSYQPSGIWPTGLSPREACLALRSAFPGVRIGAGVLTNFTEFNRRRPDDVESDYVTHGSSAVVHAADDGSVMQTLETMPHTFRSAHAISGRRAYRLGLTAIGMRSNPYGAAVSANPDQRRLTMATWDPRTRGLFGAAWAVGALSATMGHGVEALALAAPVGPFGVLARSGPVARPWYDEHPEAEVYPIFHVLKALATAEKRLAIEGLPEGLAGIAVTRPGGTRLVIANPNQETQSFSLAAGRSATLDAATFATAAVDADWLDRAMRALSASRISLEPLAIFFFEPAS